MTVLMQFNTDYNQFWCNLPSAGGPVRVYRWLSNYHWVIVIWRLWKRDSEFTADYNQCWWTSLLWNPVRSAMIVHFVERNRQYHQLWRSFIITEKIYLLKYYDFIGVSVSNPKSASIGYRWISIPLLSVVRISKSLLLKLSCYDSAGHTKSSVCA